MNIAIDLTSIPNQKTGVGKYATALVDALGKFDNENHYWIFVKKNQVNEFNPKKKNFHIIECSNLLNLKVFRVLWEQFLLPFIVLIKKIDILHSIHYTTPFLFSLRRIITFHDMTFFILPKKHTLLKRIFFKLIIPFSAKRADRIISVSESTKKDIESILKVSGRKIDVVYEIIDSIYRPIEKKNLILEIKKKYGIYNNFILYVGTLEPRKNVSGLIRAYHNLVLSRNIVQDLVIIGKKGWGYEEIFKTVKDLNLGDRVVFTGYVPDSELVYFYNAAEIFIYPSFYEGFGIPPLEALACGTPTISSNISSMPEVVGDAGILIDPSNTKELSQMIFKLLSSKNLRENFRKKGLERAKEFSSERMAKKTIDSYRKVLGKSDKYGK
ncbi:MAG: glycosyltransferase family 4 protein [Candidatus Helarchaeota archaeon]